MNTKTTDPDKNGLGQTESRSQLGLGSPAGSFTDSEWDAFRYLADEMSATDKAEFEGRLQTSPDVAETLSRVLLLQSLVESGLHDLQQPATPAVAVAVPRSPTAPTAPTAATRITKQTWQSLTCATAVAACLLAAWLMVSTTGIAPNARLASSETPSGSALAEVGTDTQSSLLIESWLQAAVSVRMTDPDRPSEQSLEHPLTESPIAAGDELVELAMLEPNDLASDGEVVPDWMLAAFQAELTEGDPE